MGHSTVFESRNDKLHAPTAAIPLAEKANALQLKCVKCGVEFPVSEAIFCETCDSRIICPKCGTCNCITCKIEDNHKCTCIEERAVLAAIELDPIVQSH